MKVKITSEVVVSQGLKISNVAATGRTISAKITDDSGLNAYAITRDEIVPTDDSDEWTEITNETAKSNVVRTATDLVISKTIDYNTTDGYGVYYIHAKNNSGDTVSKSVNVEFKGSYGIAAETIMNLALTNASELRIDEHEPTGQQTFPTKEYRYWGATSYNYVQFNNELWRIIGVFDVDDGTGNVEKRLKIIRAEEIGNYSWDSSTSSVNFGHGVNEWSQADIMKLLNSGAYYNRGSGICYLESNNKNTTCDFTQNGLTTEAKEMIGNAKWYLGSHPTISVTTPEIYAHERGTFSGKQCTSGTYCDDKIERTTSWAGKIGLMYPSDYGYAADMTKCSSASLGNYKAYCGVTSWLKSFDGWMISPYGEKYSVSANRAFFVSSGKLGNNDISSASRIYPVTYLKSDIKIIGGLGTDTQPFILSK